MGPDGLPIRYGTVPRFRSVRAILSRPPQQMLAGGLIAKGGLVVLYGAPGSGKSFIALSLALAISSGVPEWFGLQIDQGCVAYACLEGSGGLPARLLALGGAKVVENQKLIVWDHPLSASDQLSTDRFLNSLQRLPDQPSLVVIDTLACVAAGLDENSSKDMGLVIEFSARLRRETGATVILVHHSGKDRLKGLRGHSSLGAAADVVAEIERVAKRDVRTLTLTKVKDGAERALFSFRLVPTTVSTGTTEIASCQIEKVGTHVQWPTKEHALSHNLKSALDALANCISKGAGPPNNAVGCDFEEWYELTRSKLKQSSEKHKREAFKRAVRSLFNRSKVTKIGERYVVGGSQ